MEGILSEHTDISWKLSRVLQHLIEENNAHHHHHSGHHCAHHSNSEWELEMDTWAQLETLRQLLCQLPPEPFLPDEILVDIDAVIEYYNSHNLLTSSKSITPSAVLRTGSNTGEKRSINFSVRKGDITTLTDVTAIVNAANSQLLGCFRPEHRCIDNIIHAAAGPRLRDACNAIMRDQGHLEPVGSAKVTPGFALPASYVLHTVGPQVNGKQEPSERHKEQLAKCYTACLNAMEALPPLADGRKVIAFCCISTGLFAFPSDVAARIALNAVVGWCLANPATTVTDIIFDTFLEKDWILYRENICSLQHPDITVSDIIPPTKLLHPVATPGVVQARQWLRNADYLLITAGAGLSAAIGLDYTSRDLFAEHFPAFQPLGLTRLYDVFGFQGWKSKQQKWGYYFLHLNMVRTWPQSPLYARLLDLASRFEDRYFVRTSNADELFVANAFPADRVSTPQGQYRFLQCLAKCRPDAVFPSAPFVDATLPFIDPVTQCLTDESKIPRCEYCAGELTLCVRGGDYFNQRPFRAQEEKYKQFVAEASTALDLHYDRRRQKRNEDGLSDTGNRTPSCRVRDGDVNHYTISDGLVEGEPLIVVLELGVGLNTPGVLRWPNEELLEQSASRSFRLIRAGIGAAACVPWDMEEQGLGVGLAGDLNAVVSALVG